MSGFSKNLGPPVVGGLVAWWKLNENSGTNIIDSSGWQNNGVISGTPNWINGLNGKTILNFNGTIYATTSYIIPSQDSTTSFSWSAWIYLAGTSSGSEVILGFRNGSSWIKLTPRKFEYGTSGIITNFLSAGQWTYVTIIKDKTNFNYYVNGVSIIATTSSSSVSSQVFYMGEDPNFSSDGHFIGSLSDVRIYNRALSQQEVIALYNSY